MNNKMISCLETSSGINHTKKDSNMNNDNKQFYTIKNNINIS